MIEVSEAFKEAIVSQYRRVRVRANIDLISPNFSYGETKCAPESPLSRKEEIHDRVMEVGAPPILTLEQNRWLLNTECTTDWNADIEVGFESESLSSSDGSIMTSDTYGWVEETLERVNVLQSFYAYFPDNDYDGYPVEFYYQIKHNDDVIYPDPEEYPDGMLVTNDDRVSVFHLSGFTVYYPTAIKVRITKWSLPNRRIRIPEIWPGTFETWEDDLFASFNIQKKGSFTALSLPYTTCTLKIDNSDKRFDPMNKRGLFQSLEDRQGVEISISMNDMSYVPIGKFYQSTGGWFTGDNALTVTWNLVDVIGLIVDRDYDLYNIEILPTTYDGWVASILSQLGEAFSGLYEIHPDYANISLTTTRDKIQNVKCGQLLQWLCQATRTWPRALANGKLYLGGLEGLQEVSNEINLDNVTAYPIIKANDDVARLDFTLQDDSVYSAIGTSSSSQNTVSIDNPFIKTAEDAQKAATFMLKFYGGNVIETTGRGDPTRELGDLLMVNTRPGTVAEARLVEDSLEISNHVLANCKSKLLNIVNTIAGYNYFEIITEDTLFQVPDNLEFDEGDVGVINIILIGAGSSGGHGSWTPNFDIWNETYYQGDPGEVGEGGRIYFDSIYVNRGGSYQITIGRANPPRDIYIQSGGQWWYDTDTRAVRGTPTTFDAISSDQGVSYPKGYIDSVTSKVFGRSGQSIPTVNSGDGGANGVGVIPDTDDYYGSPPTKGIKGADGCAIVYYTTVEEV